MLKLKDFTSVWVVFVCLDDYLRVTWFPSGPCLHFLQRLICLCALPCLGARSQSVSGKAPLQMTCLPVQTCLAGLLTPLCTEGTRPAGTGSSPGACHQVWSCSWSQILNLASRLSSNLPWGGPSVSSRLPSLFHLWSLGSLAWITEISQSQSLCLCVSFSLQFWLLGCNSVVIKCVVSYTVH